LQRKVLWFRAQNVLGFKVLVLAKKGFMVRAQNVLGGFRALVPAKKGFLV
jgi:hypothetical protein